MLRILKSILDNIKNRIRVGLEIIRDMARQAITQILENAKNKLESSKTSNIFSQGAVQASKEITSSFAEYIGKRRDEYAEMVQQSKMTVNEANMSLAALRGVSLFLEEKFRDFEKINFVKQGELISTNSQIGELTAFLSDIEAAETAAAAAAAEIVAPVETEVAKVEEAPVEVVAVNTEVVVKKRPDEADTKIGRAAKDVKNRRKEAQETTKKANAKGPGRPKKS